MQPKSIILFFYGYILFFRRHKRIEEMQNSKDLYFSQNGSINLNSDVDLGASVLNLIKIQIGK